MTDVAGKLEATAHMSELNLVYAEPKVEPCDCCEGKTTQLTRVVQRDGVPCAVYYAAFTEAHPERHVVGIVSVGDFTEGSSPQDREAFALVFQRENQGAKMVLRDATESPWREVELLGRMLTEREARDHPRCDEVLEIGIHAVKNDAALFSFLARAGGCAGCSQPCDVEGAPDPGADLVPLTTRSK